MILKTKFLFSVALLCAAAAGVSSQQDGYKLVIKNVAFITEKLNGLKGQIKNSVQKLENRIDRLAEPSRTRLDKAFGSAAQKISLLGDSCRKQGAADLAQVKSNFIMDLLNCKRNQEMVTDFEKIVYSAKDLMEDIVGSTETLVRGFESCLTTNPFEMSFCLAKNMIGTARLLLTATALTAEFTVEVAENSEDILKTAYWCIENADSRASASVRQITDTSTKCTVL